LQGFGVEAGNSLFQANTIQPSKAAERRIARASLHLGDDDAHGRAAHTALKEAGEQEAVAVRASLGLWDIFGRVSDRMELEERLAALEQAAAWKSNGGVQ